MVGREDDVSLCAHVKGSVSADRRADGEPRSSAEVRARRGITSNLVQSGNPEGQVPETAFHQPYSAHVFVYADGIHFNVRLSWAAIRHSSSRPIVVTHRTRSGVVASIQQRRIPPRRSHPAETSFGRLGGCVTPFRRSHPTTSGHNSTMRPVSARTVSAHAAGLTLGLVCPMPVPGCGRGIGRATAMARMSDRGSS